MPRELPRVSINDFTGGINKNIAARDVGISQFREIRNLIQDQWGALQAFPGNIDALDSTSPLFVGEIIGAGYFAPTNGAAQILVFTDGDDSGAGGDGTTGRLYVADISTLIWTNVASNIPYAIDGQPDTPGGIPKNSARNRIVSMVQANNLMFIATGMGPIKLWDGALLNDFFSEAGLSAPSQDITATPYNLDGNFPLNGGTALTLTSKMTFIPGREYEIYYTGGIGSTAFRRYNKLTNEEEVLSALPEPPTDLGHAIIGHDDKVAYLLRVRGGIDTFRSYAYDRALGAWSGVINNFSALAINNMVLESAMLPSWNPMQIIVLLRPITGTSGGGSGGGEGKLYLMGLSLNTYSDIWSSPLNSLSTTSWAKALATTTDTPDRVYIVYRETTDTGKTRWTVFDTAKSSEIEVASPETDLNGYEIQDGAELLYVRDSGETQVRLIRHDKEIALSYVRNYINPTNAWTVHGYEGPPRSVQYFTGPAICTGGSYYSEGTGPLDMAVYGRYPGDSNQDPFLQKAFFIMQNIQSVTEKAIVKYDYTYTLANDTTESEARIPFATVETQSGRPIRIDFGVGGARTLYRRIYRTTNYQVVGTPPTPQRLLVEPEVDIVSISAATQALVTTKQTHNFVIGQKVMFEGTLTNPPLDGEVRTIQSQGFGLYTFSVDVDTTGGGQATPAGTVRPLNQYQINNNTVTLHYDGNNNDFFNPLNPPIPDTALGASLETVALGQPPENASLLAISSNRLFLAGFPDNEEQGTNPSMVAFSTETDFETFDLVAGLKNLNRNDGDYITALVEQDQDSLVIFKNNRIFVKRGDPSYPNAFREITSKVGCVAPRSAVALDFLIFFMSKTGVYSFDGSYPRPVSIAIDPDITRLTPYERSLASGAFHNRKYYLALVDPDISSDRNRIVYEYGFDLQRWLTIHDQSVKLFLPLGGNIPRLFYAPNIADIPGKMRIWGEGTFTDTMTHVLLIKDIDIDDNIHDKQWRRIWLNALIPETPPNQTVSIEWSVDEERASGVLPVAPTVITATGKLETYLLQSPRNCMGKTLTLKIVFLGSGSPGFKIESLDIEYLPRPRKRGKIS